MTTASGMYHLSHGFAQVVPLPRTSEVPTAISAFRETSDRHTPRSCVLVCSNYRIIFMTTERCSVWCGVISYTNDMLILLYRVHLYYHCLTLTTFRFPFPPRLGPGPPAPPPSVVLMPAFMVSIRIPVAMAGEYVDTRLFRAG